MSILPIGTIVYLKEGSQKLMILNRGVTIDQNGESVLFDYSAALYPIGLNPEQLFYFNCEDVDKVVYPGYSDEEEERFAEIYQRWLDENSETIKKGVTKSK
ncbi:DUF4176 domain-containing protein [Streptococcus lactarius]|uniref:DUF4176 domain-containing protein n=1 Tax=Streptococcus lactarius TaxID=684066 RepID=A0A9X0WPY5_9STRE|nr:DUF4176 domain-containing protein [Streptococcus lactarius]MBK4779964.1 type II secretion protein [Streptococcus lactarius]QUB39183.1 DUF4176 domain-containing protein [Streptococcus lactarius]